MDAWLAKNLSWRSVTHGMKRRKKPLVNLVLISISTNDSKSKHSFLFAVDSRLGQAARKLDAGLEVKADLMSREKKDVIQ